MHLYDDIGDASTSSFNSFDRLNERKKIISFGKDMDSKRILDEDDFCYQVALGERRGKLERMPQSEHF